MLDICLRAVPYTLEGQRIGSCPTSTSTFSFDQLHLSIDALLDWTHVYG